MALVTNSVGKAVCTNASSRSFSRPSSLAFKPFTHATRCIHLTPRRDLQNPRCITLVTRIFAKKAADEDVDLDMVALEAEEEMDTRMKKCLDALSNNLNTLRTGRANPSVLDRVQVEYYGVPTPLKTIAGISVPEATTLMISPFDKSSLKSIEKALLESDLGINPNNDGERIRLIFPQMTQERRKELSKQASKMGEEGKVAVRNVRKDTLKKLDKHDFPKDVKKSLEDSIQKTTDGFVKRADEMVKAKSEEIMKV